MRKQFIYKALHKIFPILCLAIFFSNCTIDSDPKIFFTYSLIQNSNSSISKFSVGGSITGLTGSGLIIQNNGADNITIPGNGSFTFSTQLEANTAYSVTVLTNPSSPNQLCNVSNGSGTITTTNITNISIACATLVLSYAGSPYSYTQNIAITTNAPTVTGTITSCSASPSLPAGLSIDNTTCTISGTPTTIQASASYIITAVTSNGNLTASINITISAIPVAPTALTYSSNNYVLRNNTAITTITPSVTGTVTSCSASPTLPTGLSINSTTCAVSGTPIVNQGSTAYTITASNAGGSTTASFNITVQTTVYKIFVTASTYNGDLRTAGGGGDGPAGADNLCNADANKPNASAYKAILFASGIRDTTTSWVLLANTTYTRGSDSAMIGTTDGSKEFAFPGTPLSNSFDAGALKQYWVGFRNAPNYWQTGNYRCNEWTDSSTTATTGEGRYGLSNVTDYTSISEGTRHTCNNVKYLLCAEQ